MTQMRTYLRTFGIMAAALACASLVLAQTLTVDRFIGAGYVVQTVYLGLIAKATPKPSADHIMYHPGNGLVVVGITKHPQRSGFNGELVGVPGDCWAAFATGFTGATSVTVSDLDGNGQANNLLLYRASDGRWREYAITLDLFPGCDTTQAF